MNDNSNNDLNNKIPTPNAVEVPTIKPITIPEKPNIVVEENKVNNNTPIVNEIKTPKEEVNVKPMANPNPIFKPQNNYAPPDLTQNKEKNFEENNTYQNNIETNNNKTNEGDELYKAFIGKNYHKILTRTINIPAFFFGFLYLFFRKMFFYGILLLVIISMISIIFTDYVIAMPYLMIIPNILLGFFTNKLYLSIAEKKIKKIKNNNLHTDIEDLKTKCSYEGGTSIGNIFAGMIGGTIVLSLIILLLGFLGSDINFRNIYYSISGIDPTVESDSDLPKGKNYDGTFVYNSSIKILDIFKITIPDKFIKEDNEFSYSYKSSDDNINSTCKFQFNALKMYDDDTKLIQQMNQYYIAFYPSKVSNEKINNITWNWFSFNDVQGKKYYYATLYEKRVFLFSYEVFEEADKDCEKYRDQIIKSISFR